MGTTVIFPSHNDRALRKSHAVQKVEMETLDAELRHMDDLIDRVVKDLKSGVDVKITTRDGESVIATSAAEA